MMPIRLAVLADHFIQYQTPLFRELSKFSEIETKVYYLSDHGREYRLDAEFGFPFRWDISLDTGYEWHFLPGAKGAQLGERSLLLDGAILTLPFLADVDLIMFLVDYRRISILVMLYLCTLLNIPLIYRGDTTLIHENIKYRKLKRILLRPVFRRNVWALSVGKLSEDYIIDLSVPEKRIFKSPHAVDNCYWQRRADFLRNKKNEMRRMFNIPVDNPTVLFVGKFIDKKRPLDFAEAVCKLSESKELSTIIVGDGPLKTQLINKFREYANITYTFTGFLNQSEIANAYAAADIICLPSAGSETWGLVINEGMYFDCIPVVSSMVGCGPDLVEGVGEIFPVGDINSLVRSIRRILDELPVRKQKVKERIDQYSLDRAVQGIVNASVSSYHETTHKGSR